MEQRITIISLGATNLQASANFYDFVFGWKRMQASTDNIIFYQLPCALMLSLYDGKTLAEDVAIDHNGSGFKGFTLAYNTRSEEEVDDIISELRNKGVKIIKDPQKVFWGGYSSYIADPDDNLWEIAFNPYMIPEAMD